LVKVTIVPRGRSLGAAWYLPEERSITTTEQILDEKVWPGLRNSNSDSSALPASQVKSQVQNVLEVQKGHILTLEGWGNSSTLQEYLLPLGLEPAVIDNQGVHTAILFCDYQQTNLGPFKEFCISVLAKPKGGDLSRAGFVLLYIRSDKAVVCNLCKIVWGLNALERKIETDFSSAQDYIFELADADDGLDLRMKLGLDFEKLQPLNNKLQTRGFSQSLGVLGTFHMSYSGDIREIQYDQARDDFSFSSSSEVGDFLHRIQFLAMKWTAYLNISAQFSGPIDPF